MSDLSDYIKFNERGDRDMAIEFRRLREENERLRAALTFYADPESWERYYDDSGDGYMELSVSLCTQDGGGRAREALATGQLDTEPAQQPEQHEQGFE